MPEEGGGDVQGEAGADHLGGEQTAEVVRGEGEGPAGVGDPRGVRGRDEDGPDIVVGQDFLAGTDPAGEQVRQRLAVLFSCGS